MHATAATTAKPTTIAKATTTAIQGIVAIAPEATTLANNI